MFLHYPALFYSFNNNINKFNHIIKYEKSRKLKDQNF